MAAKYDFFPTPQPKNKQPNLRFVAENKFNFVMN